MFFFLFFFFLIPGSVQLSSQSLNARSFLSDNADANLATLVDMHALQGAPWPKLRRFLASRRALGVDSRPFQGAWALGRQ